jgi:suppressor of ftsI
VINGMAGLILVKGAIDEVPEIAAAKDYVIAVQDLGLFEQATEPGVWMYDPPQNAIWSTFEGKSTFNDEQGMPMGDAPSGFSTGDYPLRLFLVNGSPVFEEAHNATTPTQPIGQQLEVPRFKLRPGEVARFRVLNGCSDNLIPLMVEQHDMHWIAVDGVNFTAPRLRPYVANAADSDAQVLLPSGGRAEFLLQAIDTPGVYAVKQIFQKQQFLESAEKTLFELEISGEPVSMKLPSTLPTPTRHYPLLESDQVSVRRSVVFGMVFPPVVNKLVGLDFEMNGVAYDEQTVEFQPKLGAVEEWTIDDEQMHLPHGATGSAEGHPFHLHTNSFEVISIDGVPVEPGTIQDTVWVPHAQKVVIRVKFDEWTGKDVFHCHILPHEDTGMMQNLLITR